MGRLNKKTSFSDVFSVGFCLFFVGFSVISFLSLTSTSSFADTTASALASVTVGSACTLSAVENTAHVATIPAGTSISEMGQTTFTMVCNDSGGYSIYAIGYGNNELGNTKLLANINGTLAPDYDINTGTNASGTPSSWAMKLSPSTNLTSSNILNGYGSYSLVPTTYTKIATLIPSTTIPSSSSLLATYRVNVAHTQPAGNYYGKVRFVMVNPAANVPNEPKTCTANKICYWPNGGDITPAAQGGVGVPDSMGDQTPTSSEESSGTISLWTANFKRTGYGFVGWSDAYDWVANVGSESNPNAHIYGQNEVISIPSDLSANGLSLYAVWVKSKGNLQNWNGCSSLTQGKVTALTDLRDNDTYAVAKLADDKCWMIENLRLDDEHSRGEYYESLAQGYAKSGIYGNFIGLAESETITTSSSSPNSIYYSGTQSGSATIDIGAGYHSAYRFPRYNNNNTNPLTMVDNMTGKNYNVYNNGNYYSWAAAIADTTDYYDGQANLSIDSTSICPSGWRLPRGGQKVNESNNDFWYLIVTKLNNGIQPANYSSNNTPYYNGAEAKQITKQLLKYPNNFIYSGRNITNRGSDGNYWTSTSRGNIYNKFRLYFSANGTRLDPGDMTGLSSDLLSVRCLVGS